MASAQETLPMPRRAYPYGRVSTKGKQTKGRGLDRQEDFAQQISDEEGWFLDDAYHFCDAGRSGFHGDNLSPTADLTRFLDLVKAKQITPGSVLIVENLDRLSRQEVDVAYDLFRDIIKRGIWIATKFPRRVYRKENSSFMELMEPIWLMYLAHQESLKKSERGLDKWADRRRTARESGKPYGARVPAWITLSPTGSYALIPWRAATVKKIFDLCREGLGVNRITAWLRAHAEEYLPFGSSGDWTAPYVRHILASRVPIGEYQPRRGNNRKSTPDGAPIANYFPAVVSEDEWRVAQACIAGRKLAGGRPGSKEANLFTGIVFEAVSRLPMSIAAGPRNKDGDRLRYLVTARRGLSCQRSGGLPYQHFEEAILDTVRKLRPSDVLPPDGATDARQARIDELDKHIKALEGRAAEIASELENTGSNKSVSFLTNSYEKLIEEKATAWAEYESLRLESHTSRGESLTGAQTLIELLDRVRGTPDEAPTRLRLKAALRWVIECVWVRVQPIHNMARVGHVQVYLRGVEKPRYVQIRSQSHKQLPGRAAPRFPAYEGWDVENCDFRAGDVGHGTPNTKVGTHLVG